MSAYITKRRSPTDEALGNGLIGVEVIYASILRDLLIYIESIALKTLEYQNIVQISFSLLHALFFGAERLESGIKFLCGFVQENFLNFCHCTSSHQSNLNQ